jgi:hypothetical protein
MANSDSGDGSIEDTSPAAKLSPAVVVFMDSQGDRRKDLLAYLVRERFIAVCVLVAIAASLLIAL